MPEKHKVKFEVEIECGSLFQAKVVYNILSAFASSLEDEIPIHHKDNKVTWTLYPSQLEKGSE